MSLFFKIFFVPGFLQFQAIADLIVTLGWSHVTAIIDSTWSQATIQKLHDVAGLRQICIVDVTVIQNEIVSIQHAVRRIVKLADEGRPLTDALLYNHCEKFIFNDFNDT